MYNNHIGTAFTYTANGDGKPEVHHKGSPRALLFALGYAFIEFAEHNNKEMAEYEETLNCLAYDLVHVEGLKAFFEEITTKTECSLSITCDDDGVWRVKMTGDSRHMDFAMLALVNRLHIATGLPLSQILSDVRKCAEAGREDKV